MTLALMLIATGAAQSTFTLKVHTGRGPVGYDVNSTMIIGERDILVIDPQFSLSEAHKLAAEILESKKRLVTIYSTHAHPDHLFGLAVLKQAFPDAKIVALPATVNAAKTGLAGAPEILARHLRHQHSRARAGAAGGISDARAHARG
jgi:glyoxylase-like metal-dependent hydrolase (beta-lactamase superfamily II)